MEQKKGYKDLLVWQKSMEVTKLVYELTVDFPDSERFGLVSQLRRCAISIPSNIAEGRYRGSKKSYRQFLIIAFASGAELETQLELSVMLGFVTSAQKKRVSELHAEVMKMLNVMISRMQE